MGKKWNRGHNHNGGKQNSHNNNRNDNINNRYQNNNNRGKDRNSRGNHRNSNDRIQKHHNNNSGSQVRCEQCKKPGHLKTDCFAKILSQNQWCSCGNKYHTTNRCPLGGDPKRGRNHDMSKVGLICQWCKGESKGDHNLEDCDQLVKFRTGSMEMILAIWDQIDFCWHCESTKHRTRACDNRTMKEMSEAKWHDAINKIVNEWIHRPSPMPQVIDEDLTEDLDGDAVMALARESFAPPIVKSWCHYCQVFGHSASAMDCPPSVEYMAKSPYHLKHRNPPVEKRPYNDTLPTFAHYSPQANLNYEDTFEFPCLRCLRNVRFQKEPGPWGATTRCPNPTCFMMNPHPNKSTKKDKEESQLAYMHKILEVVLQGKSAVNNLKAEEEHFDPLRRPSEKNQDIFNKFPPEQPFYRQNYQNNKVMKKVHYFNEPGNHQSYFPSTKMACSPDDMAISEDSNLSINKAGSQGCILMCKTCSTVCNVYDLQDDVVMLNTTPGNTVGYGSGIARFVGSVGNNLCKCKTLVGERPELIWVKG